MEWFSVQWASWPFWTPLSSGNRVEEFENYEEAEAFFKKELENTSFKKSDGNNQVEAARQIHLIIFYDGLVCLSSDVYCLDSYPAFAVRWETNGVGHTVDPLSTGYFVENFDDIDKAVAFFEKELHSTDLYKVQVEPIPEEVEYLTECLYIYDCVTQKPVRISADDYWVFAYELLDWI